MKLTYAIVGLVAFGGVALSVGTAAAMPMPSAPTEAASNITQARYCGRSYNSYGGGGYYSPRHHSSYGYGGGWRGRRWY